VDEELLKANGIAPGNEYKVVGALRFLGLVDQAGNTTEQCRILKTRGPTLTLGLQEMVRQAYQDLFEAMDASEATRDRIYNFFVREHGLGAEMANKATRFFIDLCRWAEIGIASLHEPVKARGRGKKTIQTRGLDRADDLPSKPEFSEIVGFSPVLPFVIAITPEMTAMDEDELVSFFKKLRNAMRRLQLEE
jgi:hypothetical protein